MNTKKAVWQLKQLEKLAPKKMRLAAEWPKNKKWQILISTILSSQTRDEKTLEVSKNLYKKYLTVEKLSNAKLSEIMKIIKPINYYKTKARHIKETAKIISKQGIPKDINGLLELPGVGRKVGNVYLAEAHKADAIGVDTHLSRVSRKLGWTKNTNAHKIEKDLENLFPKKYWRHLDYIVVRFGRSYWTRGKRTKEDELLVNLIN